MTEKQIEEIQKAIAAFKKEYPNESWDKLKDWEQQAWIEHVRLVETKA